MKYAALWLVAKMRFVIFESLGLEITELPKYRKEWDIASLLCHLPKGTMDPFKHPWQRRGPQSPNSGTPNGHYTTNDVHMLTPTERIYQ